jgi:8-oxo-dGTP diphosphatase
VRENRVGAYGVLVDDGRILVIKKAKGPYKGQFDLPGGGMKFGESPQVTLHREFMEEAGVTVSLQEVLHPYSAVSRFQADTGDRVIELHHVGFLFRVILANEPVHVKTDPDGQDSLGAVWLPVDQLEPVTCSPLLMHGFRAVMER